MGPVQLSLSLYLILALCLTVLVKPSYFFGSFMPNLTFHVAGHFQDLSFQLSTFL